MLGRIYRQVPAHYRHIGLGEYPGYVCYDANRPSWLPYWIDTLTESACKYNPSTIAGNIYACVTRDPSCNPAPANSDPTVSGININPSAYPQCGTFQRLNPYTKQCEFNVASPSLVLIAAVGVLALLLVAKL